MIQVMTDDQGIVLFKANGDVNSYIADICTITSYIYQEIYSKSVEDAGYFRQYVLKNFNHPDSPIWKTGK